MIDYRNFYINGAWVAPSTANDYSVINPSNEQVAETISLGTEADTDAAVAAAKEAFWPWAETAVEDRIAALERLLAVYKERSEEMAQAISTEMGAPIDMSRSMQVGAGLGHLQNTIDVLKTFEFSRPLGEHAPGTQVLLEPVGVAALIQCTCHMRRQ